MQELYSEYDGLAEKWAMPLHTTSGPNSFSAPGAIRTL